MKLKYLHVILYYEVNENQPFGEETLFDQTLAFKHSLFTHFVQEATEICYLRSPMIDLPVLHIQYPIICLSV